MSRRKLALLCLAAVIAFGTGIAMAKAVKVALSPFPAVAPIEPDASGKVILNYAKGADKTEIQINCKGLTPASDYTVYLNAGGFYAIGTFTTDAAGDAPLHVRLPGNRSGDLPVAVNNAANLTVLLGP